MVEPARQRLVDAVGGVVTGLSNLVVRGDAFSDAHVSRFDLDKDTATDVFEDVLKAVNGLPLKQFLNYDPSYQTSSSQVLVEALDGIPELARVDALIRGADVPDDAGGSSVVAMAHTIGTGENKVVAYRLKGPGIATRRPRGIPLLPRDGVYRRVKEDLLYYEPRFDMFTCSGFAYFTTVSLIQTKLHADEKARVLARDTLKSVTAEVRIDGFEHLEQAVMDDPSMRAKMAAVARLVHADPLYAEHLTTSRLIDFVETYPDYDIPVSTVDGKKALRFDPSPQHRHKIPHLLADDYLHSHLTDRSYEAGSKQRVEA